MSASSLHPNPILWTLALSLSSINCATSPVASSKDRVSVALNGKIFSEMKDRGTRTRFYVVEESDGLRMKVCARYRTVGSRIDQDTCRGGRAGHIAAIQADMLERAGQKALEKFLAAGGAYPPPNAEPFVLDISDELSEIAEESDGFGADLWVE